LYRFLAIAVLLDVKDIPQVGPLQWGWISTSSMISAVIMKSMDIIEKFWGKRPRGWFDPGLTQTYETLDYLAEAGVEYIGD
jgi:alpha-amylase/alpha-mannosidase (GH57 family)